MEDDLEEAGVWNIDRMNAAGSQKNLQLSEMSKEKDHGLYEELDRVE